MGTQSGGGISGSFLTKVFKERPPLFVGQEPVAARERLEQDFGVAIVQVSSRDEITPKADADDHTEPSAGLSGL